MTLPRWFNPINLITGLVIVILLLSVFGTTSDKVNTELNQELVRIAIDQNDRMLDQQRLNLGIYLPVLLDLDEDVEQIKKVLNISRDTPNDRVHIDFNGTSLMIRDDNFNGLVELPKFNVTSINKALHEEAERVQTQK